MRTFFADIIPKIQRFSLKLDDLTKLTNQHWVSITDIGHNKKVFIFRQNNQLLMAENGVVEKGFWEYLGNQSLLIDTKTESYLLKHGFFDEHVIALKLDSTDNYVFFVNETKYDRELQNITDVLKFLSEKYLTQKTDSGTLGRQERQNLTSRKLPKPNLWVEQMLMSDASMLINTTILWKQFCNSHSEFYPLYTYQELMRRGVAIPKTLKFALDEYADAKGYPSFDKMSQEYFD
ncbi:MAG: hypothetical protein EOO46_17465 [Flavobacterium sp.]|nr:MAG: hypothetical protein EOO46_17465 [Flavobacterium sp.]